MISSVCISLCVCGCVWVWMCLSVGICVSVCECRHVCMSMHTQACLCVCRHRYMQCAYGGQSSISDISFNCSSPYFLRQCLWTLGKIDWLVILKVPLVLELSRHSHHAWLFMWVLGDRNQDFMCHVQNLTFWVISSLTRTLFSY